MTGRFISFEGGEGAGKTTQIALLALFLRQRNHDVVTTREPGGTPGAEAIRALLVSGKSDRWDPLTEVLLINAARADHVTQLIRPALARGAWVLCDRFVDSTLAYQGSGKGIERELLIEQHRLATGNLWPDLTILLDLPTEIGVARARTRAGIEDRFERLSDDFHQRISAAFRDIAASDPKRFRTVDGLSDAGTVADAVREAIAPLLDA